MSGESFDRRTVLGALAGAGAASLAGCSLLQRGEDASTTPVPEDEALDLATRFAPTLYFDEGEQWFPTDPRRYTSEADGETVVDGFDAFDGYVADGGGDDPPAPTVFYNAVSYDGSPLAVVQFWFYSAFDQFTTNFHWHDWEVLHVFVDTGSGEPQLHVASSHSGRVPNNEFLDPPDAVPRVLSELGSHSSALSLNDQRDQFQRLPLGDELADITNSTIAGVETVSDLPVAYGLPRDEGGRLPYVVPELDGTPVYDHERLPAVTQEDLVPAALTVRSFDALASPPSDLPERSTGRVFRYGGERDTPTGDDGVGDAIEYELVPSSEAESITEFTGPQLSFEFAVPEFAEDAISGHISTAGVPWEQDRYENPAADISDPAHQAEMADRYDALGEPSPVNAVVAGVTEAVTTDEAPENEGLTTQESSVEAVALLESEPAAVPTFRGVAVVRDVPAGEHRLTVNAAGAAPHSERVTVAEGGDGPDTPSPTATATDTATATGTDTASATDAADFGATPAGVGGEIPLVAREDATKLAVDGEASEDDLTDLAVEDDFAGRLYDAPLEGRDAVYIHRGGAYTTEVRDAAGEIGADRVNPADEDRVPVENPRTGKGSLAEFLADIAAETQAEVAAVAESDDGNSDDDDNDAPGGGDGGAGGDGGSGNAVQGLARALGAIADAAQRAAERAEAGDRGGADQSLRGVSNALETVGQRLQAARDDLPEGIGNAAENRLGQARRRAEQAQNADKL